MEMPALCRAAPPQGPAPAAHEGPRLGPHGWRSLPPVVGVSCVLHGARAPPGPLRPRPLTSLSLSLQAR